MSGSYKVLSVVALTALAMVLTAPPLSAADPVSKADDDLTAWDTVSSDELGGERAGATATSVVFQDGEQTIDSGGGDVSGGDVNLAGGAIVHPVMAITNFNTGNNVQMSGSMAIIVNIYN